MRPRATRVLPGSSRSASTPCARAHVLLDDDHRSCRSRHDRRHSGVDLADHDQARGRARARRTAAASGLLISARPIATICCWPPDSAVAGCAARSPRGSGTARTAACSFQRPRRCAVAADQQVLLDATGSGTERRPSGTSAMPRRTIVAAGRPPIGVAVQPIARGRPRNRPVMRLQERRLARAVRTDHRDDLARVAPSMSMPNSAWKSP